MKSLERRFNTVREKNIYWSSYLCFAEAIRGQGFGRQAISRWLNKLVDLDEYEKENKKELVAFLLSLSTTLRKHKNGGSFAFGAMFHSEPYIEATPAQKNAVREKV